MPALEIYQFPCLKDNYGVLVHMSDAGLTASIDAPDAEPVKAALAEKDWRLTHILVTHHHADHTAGIPALKEEWNCTVIGPKQEAGRIPGIDRSVAEPDTIELGNTRIKVLDTPGHTLGHISYWIPEENVAFVGDTLFAMGCGRVLEGDHETMWSSLKKIAALPPETMIYCGHEYTLANAKFGLTIEPENEALRERARSVEQTRAEGKPTLPTRLSDELRTNVFLRPHVSAIRKRLDARFEPDWRVFGKMRELKNKA